MRPNDEVNPALRADPVLRGTGERLTEPTCRYSVLRVMKPPSLKNNRPAGQAKRGVGRFKIDRGFGDRPIMFSAFSPSAGLVAQAFLPVV